MLDTLPGHRYLLSQRVQVPDTGGSVRALTTTRGSWNMYGLRIYKDGGTLSVNEPWNHGVPPEFPTPTPAENIKIQYTGGGPTEGGFVGDLYVFNTSGASINLGAAPTYGVSALTESGTLSMDMTKVPLNIQRRVDVRVQFSITRGERSKIQSYLIGPATEGGRARCVVMVNAVFLHYLTMAPKFTLQLMIPYVARRGGNYYLDLSLVYDGTSGGTWKGDFVYTFGLMDDPYA